MQDEFIFVSSVFLFLSVSNTEIFINRLETADVNLSEFLQYEFLKFCLQI